MKKFIILSSLLIASASANSAEQSKNSLSYNYIGIGYGANDLDDGSTSMKLTGYGAEASGLINESFFITGVFSNASTDKVKVNSVSINADVDVQSYALGIGYRQPISADTDVYAIVGGVNQKVKLSATGVSETERASAATFDAGIKTLIAENLQLKIEAGVILGDMRGKTELQYKVSSNIAATAGFALGKDSTSYLLGIRYLY